LPDGTKFSTGSEVLDFGDAGICVPIFAPIYEKDGSLGTLIWIDPTDKSIFIEFVYGWNGIWEKKGDTPFAAVLELYGGLLGGAEGASRQDE
jgi:hypothetical protein